MWVRVFTIGVRGPIGLFGRCAAGRRLGSTAWHMVLTIGSAQAHWIALDSQALPSLSVRFSW